MFNKKKRTEDDIVTIDVNELVEKKRSLVGISLLIVNIIGFSMTLFQLYVAGFKTIDVTIFRALHLAFGLCIVFLTYPMTKKSSREKIPWYDYILAVISTVPNIYLAVNLRSIAMRMGNMTTMDIIMGVIFIITILEASRRVVGPVLTSIALFFLFYTMFGSYFPGPLAHRGTTLGGLIRHMYMTTEGVFGVALGASASFIFLFCLLGALMNEIGADDVLINLAVAGFGKQRGGPAKAAVISSALFGMISGSSLANITTTGTFTIPLMKKIGYEPEFAGAVEAAASIGGQIMPPVMGAAAFIIAEFLGVGYLEVCLAAALPAVLYFTSIFVAVHVKALALGLKGVPEDELPNAKELIKTRGHLLLPLIIIVVILVMGYSPSMAGFISILCTIAISYLNANTRLTPKKIFVAFANGAKAATDVIMACAVVGFIIGSFTLSGMGVKMASLVLSLGRGNLLLTMLFTALASIILGMGVPTTANYIMMAMITVPAAVQMGVLPMAAHLFCFYFGLVADLTPPVALGALTASGIAKSKFTPTAINATKLGVAAYIVPFFFVYNPVLLLGQVPFSFMVILQALFAILGICGISSGLTGYFFDKLNALERVLLIAGSVALIFPEIYTSLIGIVIIVVVALVQIMRKKRLSAVA